MIEKRVFKIWGYTVSHGTLFLRSEMQYPDVDYDFKYSPNCTIDIEFVDVSFVKLDTDFILERLELIPKGMNHELNEKIEGDSRIYEIKHNKGMSYVIAGACLIGKSNWITKHRMISPELQYPELLSFPVRAGHD